MDWFEVLLAALAGGLGAALATLVLWLLARRSGVQQRRNPWLFGVLIVLGMVLVNQTLIPPIRSWKHGEQVDRYLRTDSLYSVLIADNPEITTPLRTALMEAYGTSRSRAIASVREIVASVLLQYIRTAPDQAVVDYVGTMARTLRNVAITNPDECYRLLFPHVSSSPGELNNSDEMVRAMRSLVLSARSSPTPVPTESDVAASLDVVLNRLIELHGADVSLLQNPTAPGVDRVKVCELTIDLYAEALKLPVHEAGPLLRFLFNG